MATVLVTAGPTREYLDAVRFLSNESSGRMGYAIAAAAAARGHRALLVSGPVALPVPDGVERFCVTSAQEMLERCQALFADVDVAFGVAAVADLRPAARHEGKPPKPDRPVSLALVPNPDVVATLAARKGSRIVVGFALEAAGPDAMLRARDKLVHKHLDLIVVNATDALGKERSQVTLLHADGREEPWPSQSKDATAAQLVECAVAMWRGRTEEDR